MKTSFLVRTAAVLGATMLMGGSLAVAQQPMSVSLTSPECADLRLRMSYAIGRPEYDSLLARYRNGGCVVTTVPAASSVMSTPAISTCERARQRLSTYLMQGPTYAEILTEVRRDCPSTDYCATLRLETARLSTSTPEFAVARSEYVARRCAETGGATSSAGHWLAEGYCYVPGNASSCTILEKRADCERRGGTLSEWTNTGACARRVTPSTTIAPPTSTARYRLDISKLMYKEGLGFDSYVAAPVTVEYPPHTPKEDGSLQHARQGLYRGNLPHESFSFRVDIYPSDALAKEAYAKSKNKLDLFDSPRLLGEGTFRIGDEAYCHIGGKYTYDSGDCEGACTRVTHPYRTIDCFLRDGNIVMNPSTSMIDNNLPRTAVDASVAAFASKMFSHYKSRLDILAKGETLDVSVTPSRPTITPPFPIPTRRPVCRTTIVAGRRMRTCERSSVQGTLDWQYFKKDSFSLQVPKDWRVEITGGFVRSPDNRLALYAFSVPATSLAAHLQQADADSRTAYEGKPSVELMTEQRVQLGGKEAIQRRVKFLAAGFEAVETYVFHNGKVTTFSFRPHLDPSVLSATDLRTLATLLATVKFDSTR